MDSQEFTGKSVREAIEKACKELEVEEALLDIEVKQESTRGFLGIVGHRDAHIKVRKRDILKEVMEADHPSPAPKEHAEEPPATEDGESGQPKHEPEAAKAAEPKGDEPPVLIEAHKVLTGILDRMGVECEILADMRDSAAYLDIKGDGSGLLIGKKGQTLDALQFVVNKIVNKANPPGSKIEVIVDTENYRLRKREKFREMALRKIELAKKGRRPVSFDPMPASERRLVHMILAEDRDVFSKSVEDGPRRHVIVYPRRGVTNRRRRR
jgi:spoIIIJ-associated protein